MFSIRPEYLADDRGLLSYFDVVCRAAEYELRRRQRDRVLDGPVGEPIGDQTGLGEWSE